MFPDQFVNAAAGDYTLLATSPLKGRVADGSDVGADFAAVKARTSGVVEGLNNKIRVVTRRSYGFRTYKAMEIALYHNLGRLALASQPLAQERTGPSE